MSDARKDTTTIRMRRCGVDSTLSGYVFSDHAHARQWLAPYAGQDGFAFEEVQVGPLMRCTRCGGSGYHQHVKTIGKRTFAEVLGV